MAVLLTEVSALVRQVDPVAEWFFKFDSAGYHVVHRFTGHADGGYLSGGLSSDAAGNIYGTASVSSTCNCGGVIFKIDPSGVFSTLYLSRGDGVYGGVVPDAAGNLYGATINGGTENRGVVFKLDPMGNETVLYNFTVSGVGDYWGVNVDPAGNVYGVRNGVIYKIDTSGTYSVLYTFTGGTDGKFPNGVLVLDAAGNLYGTAQAGGATGHGVVFKVDPAGNESVLYNFHGPVPYIGLSGDAEGNLYGTDGGGEVFKIGCLRPLLRPLQLSWWYIQWSHPRSARHDIRNYSLWGSKR